MARIYSKKSIKRWKILLRDKKDNKKDLFSLSEVITLVILTLIFSFSFGYVTNYLTSSNKDKTKENDSIEKFISGYNEIKEKYYAEIDDEKAMDIALSSIINSLDDYTTVVDDSLSNTLTTKLQGEYQGFGIEVANDINMNIVIVNVIKDSPAEKAKLQPLDVIKKIDGISVTGLTTTEFVNKIKELNKANYEFEIERNGSNLNIKLTREKVVLNSVASQIYSKNSKKIGYIYVSVFAQNTDKQFIEELSKLEKQGIDSLIVDLRYNTGGHLTAVENMMSYMLDKSHIIYQIETKGKIEKFYSTGKITKNYPMIVLVNNNSASAAEMFTATMQEEYGAVVVGTHTFGKGTVQEVLNSDNVSDDFKITTSKWLTPKGKWINGTGVIPDVEIELNVKDINNFTDEEDNQLQKGIEILAK